MKRIYCLFQLLPLFVMSQDNSVNENLEKTGIHFEQGLCWQQIKQKAKTESKCIFIDCYASWCGPCKEMDKNVYLNPKVADYFNEKFISVKMQMDTSKTDRVQERKWYEIAHKMQREYQITEMPTYLFFSQDGNIVHKDLGYKNPDDLIVTGGNALNLDKQYYTLKNNYRLGKKDYAEMPYLAFAAKKYSEDIFAISVAQDYLKNYLYKLNDELIYTNDNLNLIATFMQSSKERGFNLFYRHAVRVDKIMGKGYSQFWVDYFITKKEISPVLHTIKGNIDPNWSKITNTITKKYGPTYSLRNILNAKVRWYKDKKNWPQYTKYAILQIGNSKIDTTNEMSDYLLNNTIWDVIFLHSTNKKEINRGIGWMKGIVRRHPTYAGTMDTYANLIYKAGNKYEAIATEEKAIQLNSDPKDKSFHETLEKMRKGEPTWNQD